MACLIEIDRVLGLHETQSNFARLIYVYGTAQDCLQLEIRFSLLSSNTLELLGVVDVIVDDNGYWFASIELSTNNVDCNRSSPPQIKIEATCSNNSKCAPLVVLENLVCRVDCPEMVLEIAEIAEACINGQHQVSFRYSILNVAVPISYRLNFGDGEDFVSDTETDIHNLLHTHFYTPGQEYQITLTTVEPFRCPTTASVQLGSFDHPLLSCNVIECEPVTVEELSINGCIGEDSPEVSASFELSFTPGVDSCRYLWDFSDGSPEVQTSERVITHTYTETGEFFPSVVVVCGECQIERLTSPEDFSSVRVSPCLPGSENCPEITRIKLHEQLDDNGLTCAGDGQVALVLFELVTSRSPRNGDRFFWMFDDGFQEQTQTPLLSRTFESSGTRHVHVRYQPITLRCPPSTIGREFQIQRCPSVSEIICPTLIDLVVTATDKIGEGQSAVYRVSLEARTNDTSATGRYSWNFGNESAEEETDTAHVEHDYTESGSVSVTVIFHPNQAGCESSSESIDIEVPEGIGGGGGGGGGRSSGACFSLRQLTAVLATLSLLSLQLFLCFPELVILEVKIAAYLLATSIALGALSVGAGVLWGVKKCPRPCNAALLLGWQVALGASLVALSFKESCCGLQLAGFFPLAVAIGLFYVWMKKCKLNLCDAAAEAFWVVTAVVAPIIAFLGLIPVIENCISREAVLVQVILEVAIGAKLLKCDRRPNQF